MINEKYHFQYALDLGIDQDCTLIHSVATKGYPLKHWAAKILNVIMIFVALLLILALGLIIYLCNLCFYRNN